MLIWAQYQQRGRQRGVALLNPCNLLSLGRGELRVPRPGDPSTPLLPAISWVSRGACPALGSGSHPTLL